MKTLLQENLLQKFPQLFPTDRKIYTGPDTMNDIQELLNQKEMVIPIQFGFECEDGWYMLLDELMSEIQSHIENENRTIRFNELKYKWMWKLQNWIRLKRKFKIADWIYNLAPKVKQPPINVKIHQIKEKFGGLRFYYSGGDERIHGMVGFAETLSYKICEHCGSTKNVSQTKKGWITTLCEDCMKPQEK
jgi:hypothetical protein